MRHFLALFFLCIISFSCINRKGDFYPGSRLLKVPFNEIRINDPMWIERIRIIQRVTIPSLLYLAEKQGKLDNFRIIAGRKKGKISLYNAPDSDIYKLIEAAGYSFTSFKDEALLDRIKNITQNILSAQYKNGYLHTQYMIDLNDPSAPDTTIKSNHSNIKRYGFGPKYRWTSKKENWPFAYSQLYCAGHLMDAAVAWYQGTGETDFLKGAVRFADHNCKVFNEEKIKGYADHPEVEIGLIKLYEVTGNGTFAEQHGYDFDLPVGPACCECCANIAEGQWNHQLNLLTADSKFADLVEIEAYNSALSGISLDGQKFFYSNKINIATENRKDQHTGVREHYLFCCPSKLPRFIAGIGRWIYAKDDKNLYINMFIGSDVSTRIGNETAGLKVETPYPCGNSVGFTFTCNSDKNLRIRIPGWCSKSEMFDGSPYFFIDKAPMYPVKINGETLNLPSSNGYIDVNHLWKKGNTIELIFNMPVRRVYSDERIRYSSGRVALMRGPVLFCHEGEDNNFDIGKFTLPLTSNIISKVDSSIFNGMMTLTGEGMVGNEKVSFKAIPYFAWQNRGISKMSLLLVEDPINVFRDKDDNI